MRSVLRAFFHEEDEWPEKSSPMIRRGRKLGIHFPFHPGKIIVGCPVRLDAGAGFEPSHLLLSLMKPDGWGVVSAAEKGFYSMRGLVLLGFFFVFFLCKMLLLFVHR